MIKNSFWGGGRKKGILKRNPFKKECEKEGTRGFLFGGVKKKEQKKECTKQNGDDDGWTGRKGSTESVCGIKLA